MLSPLPCAKGEPWDFESGRIEGPTHSRAPVHNTPRLDRLLSRHSSSGRPSGKDRARRRWGDDTVVGHLMRAADPVQAVSGGTDWRPDVALRALASRARAVSPSVITEVLKDDPTTEEGGAAFAEVCASIGVGLVVQDGGGAGILVVRICDDVNVWIQKNPEGGWSAVPWCTAGVNAKTARELVSERVRERASRGDVGIAELRRLAATCGIDKPYPRAKEALSHMILDSLCDAGRRCGRSDTRSARAALDGVESL